MPFPTCLPDLYTADRRVPLSHLMGVPQALLHDLQACPVEVLSLSVRALNCMHKAGINSVGKLLGADLETLWGIKALGRSTLGELVEQLAKFLQSGPRSEHVPNVGLQTASPAALRSEWETFSGGRECPSHLPIEYLDLAPHAAERLHNLGLGRIESLLELPLSFVGSPVDEELLESILLALPPVAFWYAGAALPERPSEARLRSILRQRWAGTAVSDLGLSDGAVSRLQQAGIWSMGRLLTALERLEVFFDVPLYLESFGRLVELGVTAGRPLDKRAQFLAEGEAPATLDAAVEFFRAQCNAREWEVIVGRCGLPVHGAEDARPQTYRSIGERLGISGQGAKTIHHRVCGKVTERDSPALRGPLGELERTLEWLIQRAGGLASVDHLVEELTRLIPEGEYSGRVAVLLVLGFSERFVDLNDGALYATATAPWRLYGTTRRAAQELWDTRLRRPDDRTSIACVVEHLRAQGEKLTQEWVAACLRTDPECVLQPDGAFSMPSRPLRHADALIATLRRIGAPAQLKEIHEALVEQFGAASYANEHASYEQMSRHPELFERVGRGIFALVEWGLTENTKLLDRVVTYLRDKGEPVPEDELAETLGAPPFRTGIPPSWARAPERHWPSQAPAFEE